MPGKKVEITYEAIVKGIERIEDLTRKNAELQKQTESLARKNQELTSSQEKNTGVLLKARQAYLSFRKEMFALTLAAGTLVAGLKILAGTSDLLAERMEKLGDSISKYLKSVGDSLARVFGSQGELSRQKQIELLNLQSDVLELRGKKNESILLRMEAEEKKFTQSIKTLSKERQMEFEKEFKTRQLLTAQKARLSEFGLNTQADNISEAKQALVGGVQGTSADVLFKALQGEQQTIVEVLKSFQTSINRTIADFITKSLFTFVFKRFDPVLVELQRQTKLLQTIADCGCKAPLPGAREISISGALGGARAGGLGLAASIAGSIGSLAGGIGALGSLAGFAGAGGAAGAAAGAALPAGAGISFGPGAFATGRHGGWSNQLPRYQNGGEIPAILHSGEFVVNSRSAQANKDLLKDINGGKPVQGSGGNVFLIKTNDAGSFARMLANPASQAELEVQIIKKIMNNGQMRDIIKSFAR